MAQRWEGYNPSTSTALPEPTTILAFDPRTGEPIWKRDEQGNLLKDNKGRPIQETRTVPAYTPNAQQEALINDNKRIMAEMGRGNFAEVDRLAERMASGHTGIKHVQGRETLGLNGRITTGAKPDMPGDDKGTYGPKLDIADRDQLKAHIKQTLMDPNTVGYVKKDGTIIAFNQKTNTMVILNPNHPDGGTAYRPDDGVKNFMRCVRLDDGNGNLNGTASEAMRTGGLKGILAPHTPNPSAAALTPEQRLAQYGLTMQRADGGPMNRPLKSDAPQTPHPEHAGGKPPVKVPAGVRGAGMAGGIIAVAAAAGNAAAAEGRPTTAGDYGRAAWDQTVGAPLAQNRYAEAALRVLERVDVTAGLLTSGLRNAFRAAGLNVDEGMMENIGNLSAKDRADLKTNANRMAYVQREQFFLLQDAGLTEMRDENGKRTDIGAILRDPAQRKVFMDNLQRAHDQLPNGEDKERLGRVIGACNDFSALEMLRQTLLQKTEQILVAGSKPADQAAAAKAAPQAVSPIV